jgi:hypothetical protein
MLRQCRDNLQPIIAYHSMVLTLAPQAGSGWTRSLQDPPYGVGEVHSEPTYERARVTGTLDETAHLS